jgi:outer membrane protein TolC
MQILVFLLFAQSAALHQHPSVPPMPLSEIEAAALENSPEIRLMSERVALAKAGVAPAAALDDPSFTYRAWYAVASARNMNRTQHMFMFSQTIPGPQTSLIRSGQSNGRYRGCRA